MSSIGIWLRQTLKATDSQAAFNPVCQILVLVHPISGSVGTASQMQNGHHGNQRSTPALLSKKNSNSPIYLEMRMLIWIKQKWCLPPGCCNLSILQISWQANFLAPLMKAVSAKLSHCPWHWRLQSNVPTVVLFLPSYPIIQHQYLYAVKRIEYDIPHPWLDSAYQKI